MEDQIVKEPERLLGEGGLSLVARQYSIGSYRFDLLFEDRHGGKLIVEIQKGTLDRSHTYKILDYYAEYKDRHPDEFIDVMIVANVVTAERKKRLQDFGISYREIPEGDFMVAKEASVVAKPEIDVPASSEVHRESQDRLLDASTPITNVMHRYWNDRSLNDVFGFSGGRACMACLYSRPGGASQDEVNSVAEALGSTQKGYINMLRQALRWGHKVVVWDDAVRGGLIYKLVFNPENTATRATPFDPVNLDAATQIDHPPGTEPRDWT